MKIVFMGTPEFAVLPLRALIEQQHEIVGVFTQPDKPKGRGYQLASPPVKELALAHELPVYQPNTLKDGTALEMLQALAPELIVVVAYGKILPKEILELPRYGCVNVHASLLPKYRGAGPIQWSILNGEKETGVTTMYMAEGLDTGDMILKKSTLIEPNETADELHDRLAVLGAELLIETVDRLIAGDAPRIPQADSDSCYAPMLSKGLSLIDFTKSSIDIHNQIRGLSSWPAAYLTFNGKRLKVYRSKLIRMSGEPGVLLDSKQLIVGCGDGKAIELVEVQPEGAKKMTGSDFLRGRQLAVGTKLT